jgi:hypothetical protein
MAERKSKSEPATNDRRAATRWRTRALTDGSFVGGQEGGTAFLGTTVNVSTGGVLLRTYEALTAGQELSLTMHLPEGDLIANGTVLHVEQDPVGCRLAGVRFTALGEAQSRLLARHLQSFEPSKTGSRHPTSSVEPRPATPEPAKAAAKGQVPDAASDASGYSPLRKAKKDDRSPRTPSAFPFEGEVRR